MVDKVEDCPPKCKRVRQSRTCRRLGGFIRFRVGKSSKPWIRLRLDEFCELSGVTMRTARRCIDKIREDQESNIVVRTCYENQKWILLCSTTERLDGLKRSEPLDRQEDGRRRIIKTRKDGKRIEQEQLILGPEACLWKEEEKAEEIAEEEESEVENPNQMSFARNLDPVLQDAWESFLGTADKKRDSLSDISAPVVIRGFSQRENKDKHRKSKFDAKALNRLAFFISRNEIVPLHYDNCKIGADMGIIFKFVRDSLELGCDRQDIVNAWDEALHDCHAMCVDMDPQASAGSWRASSTSNRARKLLLGRHGVWERLAA